MSQHLKSLFRGRLNVSGVRRFHTATPTNSDMYRSFAGMIKQELTSKGGKDIKLKDILSTVWANPKITAVCPNLVIRLTSLRGEVSKLVWNDLGNNPDDIQILAVGTINIPQHLPSYHKYLDNFWKTTEDIAVKSRHGHSYEIGYDLMARGSKSATSPVLDMFNEHYGFQSNVLDVIKDNVAIITGGMRGLKDIADSLILDAKASDTFHRFIQPDNSFGTWWNIIENPVKRDENRREIYTIGTKPKNKLHITAEDVHEFYKQNKPHSNESWYITPVGNPSGTKMTPKQLASSCEAIVSHNPNATIILDTVYLRTLPKEFAIKLMEGVVSNPKVLDRVFFLDSFSKSHGLCRERLALYFSANPALFGKLHASCIAYSSGPGQQKDYQFKALAQGDNRAIEEIHEFWRSERKGLYNFLIKSKKFTHLFEEEQPHVTNDDLDYPLGLYIAIKTKPGVKAQQVFENTGALGVDSPLKDGHYIRFSVGTLTKPTYSKME